MTIDEYGAGQHGVVAIYQVLEVLSEDELAAAVNHGVLVPHRRRVYRCWGAAESWMQDLMAAILAVGLGEAWAFRHTAARVHAIPHVPIGPIRVVTARTKKPELRGVKVHTSTFLPAHHVTIKHGIPVTTAARTLVDLSASLSHPTWKKALRAAVRLGLTSYAEVQHVREEVRARGRRRTTVIDEVLAGIVGEPGDSDGEAKLVEWLVAAGLPLPEQQVWVQTPTGNRYCLDLAYTVAKIDMEYDGGDHADAEALLHDRDRDDDLILMGYAVIRDEADHSADVPPPGPPRARTTQSRLTLSDYTR